MSTVLLITDLEGVAGVDALEALVGSSPGHGAACHHLTSEVLAATEGFLAAGYDQIRVSDSHRSGVAVPNVDAARLPPSCSLHYERDAYNEKLFHGASVLACLGMHAATDGFAAHAVDVTCAWESGGRSLSETDLVLGLAAERGVPVVFVAGDDVLARSLGVPAVVVKRSLAHDRCVSLDPTESTRLIREAAGRSAVAAPPVDGELVLRLKSRWMADAALAAGAVRVDETAVRLVGRSFGERYAHGRQVLAVLGPEIAKAVRRGALAEDAAAYLARSVERRAPRHRQDEARRALAWFLAATTDGSDWSRANRALTLHMLAGHASAFFEAEKLAPVLDEALSVLREVPGDLPLDLHHTHGMARVDAAYVAQARGREGPVLDGEALRRYAENVRPKNGAFAWLLGELGAQLGLCEALAMPVRPFREQNRLADLFWLTHEVLLDTRYLQRPATGGGVTIEEVFLGVPFAVAGGHVDLAAQLAFCLQTFGEQRSREHEQLLDLLAEHQRADGAVVEPRRDADPALQNRLEAHATAAALLAFAGAG